MAKRLLLRDAENFSADMLQRILGAAFWNLALPAGIGTGYAAGIIGKAPTSSTGHLAVTASGTTMVLTMLPGWASVLRDAGGSTYDPRNLFAESDANDTATVTANATGSTRNDTVCLKVDMATAPTSDGSNLVSFVIIAGQSGGGVSNAPADGNLYLPLANVAVANAATNIAQGNVTDLRQVVPAAPNIAGGALPNGYAQVTVDQGTFTALTDITNLAVTVTVTLGRRIRVRCFTAASSTVAGDWVGLQIREGSTTLQETQFQVTTNGNAVIGAFVEIILQPTAGSHTYKISMRRVTGTGNITQRAVTQTGFVVAEDIGV